MEECLNFTNTFNSYDDNYGSGEPNPGCLNVSSHNETLEPTEDNSSGVVTVFVAIVLSLLILLTIVGKSQFHPIKLPADILIPFFCHFLL